MADETTAQATRLIPLIQNIRNRAFELERTHAPELEKVVVGRRKSAVNLLHYLALRQLDVRELQHDLSVLGLSSLGRSESYVMNALNTIGLALHRLAQLPVPADLLIATPVDTDTGPMLLNNHSDALLGVASGKRGVRIMVTMPSEAATKPELIHDLLAAGMDVMRINCAHDGPECWQTMIDNLRAAERNLGRSCKVSIDLAGPKLRTGAIEPVTRLLKVRPQRNSRGQVTRPAVIRFVSASDPAAVADPSVTIPIDAGLVRKVHEGDTLHVTDARGKRRVFEVSDVDTDGFFAATDATAYIETGAPVLLKRKKHTVGEGVVGLLPELVDPLQLKTGDTLIVTKEKIREPDAVQSKHMKVGNSAGLDADKPAEVPSISCTLPELFDCVKPGEAIWFDDGKIGGQILTVEAEQITVKIDQANAEGAKLAGEKGINVPDTTLNMPALTAKDLSDLKFAASHAEIVGMSFVRTPEDVLQLAQELSRLGPSQAGIVLKIETRLAFENLPRLLLAAMQSQNVGVMVARGDLAVELGFERLAEVQEEILWLCEAAHVPVIWATQVLESMAKTGAPSRAEVSDAVMSGRAECVMLNKGPYVIETVRFLDGLLERMATHQTKKRALLRRLSVSLID